MPISIQNQVNLRMDSTIEKKGCYNSMKDTISSSVTEIASLGSGCFWCTEAVYQLVNGVIRVKSGYMGGSTPNPTYAAVCEGNTGHAECVQIEYDPAVITFDALLEIFWNTHDPTTLNRQGNDVGTQYRSVIFYHSDAQMATAEAYIRQLNSENTFGKPVVTTLEPASVFYPAEAYHDAYYERNGRVPYCQFVVRPKVEKFRQTFADRLKTTA